MSTPTTSASVKRACDRCVLIQPPPVFPLLTPPVAAVTDAKSSALARVQVHAKTASPQDLPAHTMPFRRRKVPREAGPRSCQSCEKPNGTLSWQQASPTSSASMDGLSPPLLPALQACCRLASSRAVSISSSTTYTFRSPFSTDSARKTSSWAWNTPPRHTA